MRVEIGQRTETGRVRPTNEDAAFARATADGAALLVVADGIGGGRRGQEASALAVRTVTGVLNRSDRAAVAADGGVDAAVLLRAAFADANDAIRALDRAEGSPCGMGTTCVAALVEGDACVLVSAGDSRAYLYRDGRLAQLTDDHSRLELVRLTGRRGRGRPPSSIRVVMTRALGLDSQLEPDDTRLRLFDGDLLILCTDGLTAMLSDRDIERALQGSGSAQRAADRLCEGALARGGVDNVTVVVARFGDASAANAVSSTGQSGNDVGSSAPAGRSPMTAKWVAAVISAVALTLVLLRLSGLL